MADLLEVFPPRPIGLAPGALRAMPGSGKVALVFAGLLLIPSLIFGWLYLGDVAMRGDLARRGVQTDMLDWEVSCSTRTGQTLCHGPGHYALRPEHGGGVREAKFWTHTRHVSTPVVYDPIHPERVLTREVLEEGASKAYYVGILAPLGASLTILGFTFAGYRRRRRLAAARGRPALMPVVELTEHKGRHSVAYGEPGKARAADFPAGTRPFLVRRPPPAEAGALDVLVLATPDGDSQALDRALTLLELSEEERGTILMFWNQMEARSRELDELHSLVQRQSGPSEALDLQIYAALFGRLDEHGYHCNRPDGFRYADNPEQRPSSIAHCPRFTADIESAGKLVPGLGGSWRLESSGDTNVCEMTFFRETLQTNNAVISHKEMRRGSGKTAPLAICAAVIAYYADHPDQLRRN